MAHLSTTTSTATTATSLSTPIILKDNTNVRQWLANIKNYARCNAGRVGQSILSGGLAPERRNPLPGTPPDETTCSTNPVTSKPLLDNSGRAILLYSREPLTENEMTTLDLFDKPLTATGRRNFDHDKAAHAELARNYNAETDTLRKEDDSLLSHILSTISPEAMSLISTHREYAVSLQPTLPDNITRSSDLLTMINESFTSGNALHTTRLLLQLLTLKQDDTNSKFAQLLQEHTDQWEILCPLLEDSNNKGFVSLSVLASMTLLNSIDKTNPLNHRAIDSFFSLPTRTLNDFVTLKEELVKQNQSILSNFIPATTSDQHQAYIAGLPKKKPSTQPPGTYGAKQPGKTHCLTCHTATIGKEVWRDKTKHTGPFHFYHSDAHCKRFANTTRSPTTAHIATTTTSPDGIFIQGYLAALAASSPPPPDDISLISTPP